MSANSLFSIIMPAYNRSTLIVEALNSVKTQTYRPIEIIVIDDGSTDDTAGVVNKWAEDNEEKSTLSLRYFYQDNAGAGAARNRGIQEVQGKYIQFLDSDDIIHPERLQRLVETFEREKCDFIQTGFDGFNAETGETIQTLYGRPNENQLELALKGFLWANTLRSAFTTELVRKIGPWNVNMTCFEDREYVERAVVNAAKPCAIRDILASARRGGSARISDKLRSYEGRMWRIFCERQLGEAVRDRDDVSYEAKQAFVSRIYALGFRSKASGWGDLGKQCGKVVDDFDIELDLLGKRRRMIFCGGLWVARTYEYAHLIKRTIFKFTNKSI